MRARWLHVAASVAVASGLSFSLQVPGLAQNAPSNRTPAQGMPQAPAGQSVDVSDATITKAGGALRDVANLQENYEAKIASAPSNDMKQSLAQQANADAVRAIQSHGLSVQEYTRVIKLAQANPQVKQRLLDAANNEK